MERKTQELVVVDLSPLDALFQLVLESPCSRFLLKNVFDSIALHTALLMDPPQPQKVAEEYDASGIVGSFVGRIGSVISSHDLEEIYDGNLIGHIDAVIESYDFKKILGPGWTGEGLEGLEAYREIYSNRPDPLYIGFPRTNQLGFVDHLVKNLDHLMVKAKADSMGLVKHYILLLRQKLHLLSCGLLGIPESQEEEPVPKDLIRGITNLAYQAEYLIDQFLVRDIPIWYCLHWLIRIIERLEVRRRELVTLSARIETVVVSSSSSSNRVRGRELEVVVDLAPLDALFKLVHQSHFTPRSPLEEVLYMLALCIAVAMDPWKFLGADNSLEEVASCLGHLGFFISSLDLKKIDHQYLSHLIASLLRSSLGRLLSLVMLMLEWRSSETDDPSSQVRDEMLQGNLLDCFYLLVKRIDHMMKYKANSMGPLKYYVWRLQQKLHLFSYALKEIPESCEWKADIGDRNPITEFIRYAHMSELTIASFLARDLPMCFCLLHLYTTLLPELEKQMRKVNVIAGDTQTVVSRIIDLQRLDQFNIIPIVNNTEIKLSEIFNHPDVIRQFEIRSRSLVASYEGRKEVVFLQLLRNASYQNTPVGFEKENVSADELEISVRDLFIGRMFFVILEEVRDMNALNDIIRVLPHDLHRSRVLLTTPSLELAIQCRQNDFFNKTIEDHTSTSQSKRPTTDDDGVIGFEAEAERMLELLIRGTNRLCIISIVGMAGQGKTTLAKKLYRNPLVVNHFDTLSQCCVTQVHKKRELLLELLGDVGQHRDNIHTKGDQELAEMLYKNLKGRRFLIFLDDIWKIDAWDDLSRCFPNDNIGSRIIFTTRIQGLASQVKSEGIMQPVFPLSDEESWELLRNKVFQKESCPLELLRIGRQIAKDCRGLPLSVVLIGGLLAKVEKKVDVWEGIAKTLTSHLLSSNVEAHGKSTIELSYKHLPDFLKSCFLYFGAFIGDREILVQKLVRLWIAEGFIKSENLKSSEDMGMDYLMDLVTRSLVTVAQEKSTGGVKSCYVHDLLREFCLAKAREEDFLIQINGYDEHFSSSNDSLDYGINSNYSYSSTPTTYGLYRLSICSKRNHFLMLKPSGPFVRSLLFFARSDTCPNYSYDISFIFYNFKLLKILDLEEINIGDSFKRIEVLVLLRYLAMQSDVDIIPSSIANLWNLETFLFKRLSTKVVKIPDSIWDMDKLRHVHVNGCVSFDLEPHRLEKSSTLDNLQTFSTPSLTYGNDMVKMLRRLPGIQKLKCIFLDSWDDAGDCNHFPELEFLNRLISLKVFYNGKSSYPCEFSFPSNLKKLSLSNFRMPWSEISQLAALSNLEVLKLLDNAFEGETWTLDAKVFPKLKFLKLKTLNVKEWEMWDEVFPCLEHLSLHECEQLEEIPPMIGDINTLLKIEVLWCNSSLATSGEKIRDFQLEEYDKEIKVHIHPMARDSISSS